MLPLTLRFFVAMIACAINERQQKALEYKAEDIEFIGVGGSILAVASSATAPPQVGNVLRSLISLMFTGFYVRRGA